MRDKILFFFLGAILITLVYFASDLKKVANFFIQWAKKDLFSFLPLALTVINTVILLYVLKITKKDIHKNKKAD